MGAGQLPKKFKFKSRKRRRKVSFDIERFDSYIDGLLSGQLTGDSPGVKKLVKKGQKILRDFLGLELQDESSSSLLDRKKNRDNQDKPAAEKPKGKRPSRGKNNRNGRRKPEDFSNAKTVEVNHPTLNPGDNCPACSEGKVYRLKRGARHRSFVGNPTIEVTFYELDQLRCNNPGCESIFTAPLPEGVHPDTYDPSALSVIAIGKYGLGLPFNRRAQFLEMMGVPLASSTQWDITKKAADKLKPVFEHLLDVAAAGKLGYFDDTSVRILKLVRPETDKRTGVHTTGIVSVSDAFRVALYLSGPKHAGENRAELLKRRPKDLAPMLQMSDALPANFSKLEKEALAQDVFGCCLLHGRRGFVKLLESFPNQTAHVIKLLAKVYHHDKLCCLRGYDDETRLDFHRRKSRPVMTKLKRWLDKMILRQKVEENSALGEAIHYFRNHWERFTLFLRVPGAPLDNNEVERSLKTVVLHRKNALFYKTLKGAEVGDLFMSLIQTCRLNKANPFDYLTELLRYHELAAGQPGQWMPWNYKEALNAINSTTT